MVGKSSDHRSKANSRNTRVIRELGQMELFFQACYEVVGSSYLSCIYKLSQSILLSQLETSVQALKLRHQILQCDFQTDWKKRTFNWILDDTLKINIQQLDQHENDFELMKRVITQKESILLNAQKEDLLMEPTGEGYLPWRVVLSNSGDYIIFAAPHSLIDGVSFEIIAADLIHLLNGLEMKTKNISVLPKPVEQFFSTPTPMMHLRSHYYNCAKLLSYMETATHTTKNLSHDWKIRKPLRHRIQLKMDEIQPLHERCKYNDISLNSGMVSIFFEALSRTKSFETAGKKLSVCIPIDARRRSDDKQLNSNPIGCYVNAIVMSVKGDPNRWKERAKKVHKRIHEADIVPNSISNWLSMGVLGRYGPTLIPFLANGKDFGRNHFLLFSNLGKCRMIDDVNKKCQEGMTQIESMSISDSTAAIGFFVSIHVATVGDNLTMILTSHHPFMAENIFNLLCRNFQQMLKGLN